MWVGGGHSVFKERPGREARHWAILGPLDREVKGVLGLEGSVFGVQVVASAVSERRWSRNAGLLGEMRSTREERAASASDRSRQPTSSE